MYTPGELQVLTWAQNKSGQPVHRQLFKGVHTESKGIFFIIPYFYLTNLSIFIHVILKILFIRLMLALSSF